jgi:N-acyl-D-amino-acid deacylase
MSDHLESIQSHRFVAHGYALRKLNQAYFAFHGSYATAASAVDPIGPKMTRLRRASPSLRAFLETVSRFTRVEDLDRALAGKDSATISTSIFLPAQRTMLFCHGLPCQGQYDEFVSDSLRVLSEVPRMLQLIIKDGNVIDGTGKPAFRASVGIRDGKVTAVGDLNGVEAEKSIAAGGLVVAPGFIDIHSHSDFAIMINPRAESKIHQGITTEVTGNCGLTAAPLSEAHRQEALDKILPTSGISGLDSLAWDWTSFGDYLDHLRQRPLGINLAPLVGHATLRIAVMGAAGRPPAEDEMAAMERLLERCLCEGAFGMSTGLEYRPGAYSTTEELVRLGRVLARHDALYATHIRGEAQNLFEAVAEAVHIGKESGCRVEISHLKAGGLGNWGKAPQLLAYLDAARERGIEVAWDQYPYTAWGSGLIDYLPHWVAADGREKLAERLHDETTRQVIREEIERDVQSGQHPLCIAPWDTVRIALVESLDNEPLEGKSVAEIAAEQGRDPCDVAFDLLADEKGAVKTLVFRISEDDVRTIMQHPLTVIATDGRAVTPYGILGRGKTHPRYYGTFPRVLGRYVREEHLLSLESAIHRMTLMPAERMGLWDRGRITPGTVADLVIFDPAIIRDEATFQYPHRYPTGITSVIVGGQVVIHEGQHTGKLCGHILERI